MPPCRVVGHQWILGAGYPRVEHSEITLGGDRESFNVHPLACDRCLERIRVACLQPTKPLPVREGLYGVRASVLHDKVPDGCKRRTHSHPVTDLAGVDGAQLFLDHHPGFLHCSTALILFLLFVFLFLLVAIVGDYLDVVQAFRFEQPTEFLDTIFVQVDHDCPRDK